jgi:hypothetical protein
VGIVPEPEPDRGEGPDGRRIGPPPREDTFVKTYYVGDLVSLERIPLDNTKPSVEARANLARRKPDLGPVVELITSTAARGTWTVHDVDGEELTPQGTPGKRAPGGPRSATVGHITPFYLSISLIVRQTKEGHEEVADVLHKLRNLVYARDHSLGAQEQHGVVTNQPASVSHSVDNPSTPPASDRNARIRRLLDELRQEVEKLPGGGH